MISTLMRVSRINLRRDRVAQLMVFVVPIVFFSIFAGIFGQRSGAGPLPPVSLMVLDEDQSPESRALIQSLGADSHLHVIGVAQDRASAAASVRLGKVPAALILPRGWGASFRSLEHRHQPLELIVDPADVVAGNALPGWLEQHGARLMIRSFPSSWGVGNPDSSAFSDPVPVTIRRQSSAMAVAGPDMISYYAAGIAVMFLLFSCAGAGGSLLDEQDSGTLERVLSSRASMGRLLLAKWLHIALLGTLQVTVMFLWGRMMFGLDLFHHLPGFALVTAFTAAAAAAFGLVLGTLSRTRQQLMGIANIVILSMSALGGSMFPRELMPPAMRQFGLITFNAWALEGYLDVFWRGAPLSQLARPLAVLAALALVFLALARRLARRWERD
ncbi:MAG: ABC transporter permease [Candidatus Eiseniibacteriota bacterium]